MDTPPVSSTQAHQNKIQNENPQSGNTNLDEDAVDFQKLLNESKTQTLSLEELRKYLASQPNIKDLEQLLQALQSHKGTESLVQAIVNQIALQKNEPSNITNKSEVQSSTPANPANNKLTTLIDKIVSQIHVTDAKSISEKPAVLIDFKNNFLQNSQVLISRMNGVLQVAFQSSAFDSVQFLNQNQPQLQQNLANRLNEPVAVTVNGNTAGTSSGQNEGRSKGQYIPEPEAESSTL